MTADFAVKYGVYSILLATPAFDDEFELWAGPVFALLESGVVAARAEAQIGVVCFHSLYATPDGRRCVCACGGRSRSSDRKKSNVDKIDIKTKAKGNLILNRQL